MNDEQVRAFESFSAAEIEEYRAAFDLFDKDGNGQITSKELGSFMHKVGLAPSEQELSEMIDEIDADGNGNIDFPEFIALMARKIDDNENEDILIDAFRLFDPEGYGFITTEELRHVLNSLGEKMTPDEIEEMLAVAEADSQGQVRYEGKSLITV